MKRIILASAAFVGITSSAVLTYAATSSASLGSALELLKLPGENRRMVVKSQGDLHFKNFLSVAFNEQQPMAMRWKALMAAAESGQEKAVPELLKASVHNQWYMRNAALIAMSEVNPAESTKLAQKLLKDKALVVRSAAVEILEKNMSTEVRDLLWQELNQDYNFKGEHSLWIRHQIVSALALRPMDKETKSFAQLLTDKDERVQMPAVRGLEKLTGVKLGEGVTKQSVLVGLWKDYVKSESLTF